MPRIVLVAIDASQQAESAFQWYLNHIHKEGNVIVILHCMDLTAMTMQVEYDDETSTKIWDSKKNKCRELESKYRWKINEAGLHGKFRTESGKPGDVVIRTADEENADLIVIGSRGMSKLKRTISGSVSDYVLHHANCPVIICRQNESDDKSPTDQEGECLRVQDTSLAARGSKSPRKSPNKTVKDGLNPTGQSGQCMDY